MKNANLGQKDSSGQTRIQEMKHSSKTMSSVAQSEDTAVPYSYIKRSETHVFGSVGVSQQ